MYACKLKKHITTKILFSVHFLALFAGPMIKQWYISTYLCEQASKIAHFTLNNCIFCKSLDKFWNNFWINYTGKLYDFCFSCTRRCVVKGKYSWTPLAFTCTISTYEFKILKYFDISQRLDTITSTLLVIKVEYFFSPNFHSIIISIWFENGIYGAW